MEGGEGGEQEESKKREESKWREENKKREESKRGLLERQGENTQDVQGGKPPLDPGVDGAEPRIFRI